MADQDLNLSILRRVDPDVDEVSLAEIYNHETVIELYPWRSLPLTGARICSSRMPL